MRGRRGEDFGHEESAAPEGLTMQTLHVPLAEVEAYEKKGWVATQEWSILHYTVVMVKGEASKV